MFHRPHRCIVMAAATVIGMLAAACGGSSSPPPVVVPPTSFSSSPAASVVPSPGGQLLGARMEDDYKTLDRGMLIYTPLASLYPDEPVELSVIVIDIGQGPELTSAPIMYNGEAVDPYDVPTSADVTVKITCSSNLTCQNLPSQEERQLVSPRYEGHWAWQVIPQSPGAAFILIKALTYEKGGGALRYQTPNWRISLNVSANPAQKN